MPEQSLMSALPKGMKAAIDRAADSLRASSNVAIASHIDADGVSAAAIAKACLDGAGVRSDVTFLKKLDEPALAALRAKGADVVWFTDLGSSSITKLGGLRAVVSDHHVPEAGATQTNTRGGQALLSDFTSVSHVNPELYGIPGATDLSGAGSTLLVAAAVDERNLALAHLAILGAVGDLQDQRTRRLEGLNRLVLAEAKARGLVEYLQDLRYFGRETRPLHKMFEFSSDPFLPRITGNEEGALAFLLELGIELKDGDSWRTWSELTSIEKSTILEALREHLESCRRRPETIARLTGEIYVFSKEPRGLTVRDAKEFATLLNACGRHGKPEIGMRICMGDREDGLNEGMNLLRDHRSALSKALSWAKGSGIIRMKNVQFFDAGDEIEDTIVGTIAGMLLGSEGADRTAPMVAFAESTEFSESPNMKASARGTQELISKGMDLSVAMRRAAEKVGGIGGGHNIAAGATIPADKRDEFLSLLDEIVGSQLSVRARP